MRASLATSQGQLHGQPGCLGQRRRQSLVICSLDFATPSPGRVTSLYLCGTGWHAGWGWMGPEAKRTLLLLHQGHRMELGQGTAHRPCSHSFIHPADTP